MPARERLTIDATVARDYLDPARARHAGAVDLFELARTGAIELSAAPQGYRIDVKGDLAQQLESMFAKEGVAEAPPRGVDGRAAVRAGLPCGRRPVSS
jgi:hypothetical protein